MASRIVQPITHIKPSILIATTVFTAGAYAYTSRRNLNAEAVTRSTAAQLSPSSNGTTKFNTQSPAPTIFSKGFGLHSFRLVESTDLTHNTKRLRFEPADPDKKIDLGVAAALVTVSRPKNENNKFGLPVLRPYTPVTSPSDADKYVDLVVRRYPDGKASTHLHSLSPGETLLFAGPLGGYDYMPNQHAHVGLIAGGTGITPIFNFIQRVMADPKDQTRMTMVWSVKEEKDLVFRDELLKLQAEQPGRLDVRFCVGQGGASASTETGAVGGTVARYEKGRVTKEVLQRSGLTAGVEDDGRIDKILICGPPGMETFLLGAKKGWFGGEGSTGVLAELGFTNDRIHQF